MINQINNFINHPSYADYKTAIELSLQFGAATASISYLSQMKSCLETIDLEDNTHPVKSLLTCDLQNFPFSPLQSIGIGVATFACVGIVSCISIKAAEILNRTVNETDGFEAEKSICRSLKRV